MQRSKKILAVVEDLFFVAKINDLARRAGLEVEYVKTQPDLVEKAKLHPLMVILDLNGHSLKPVEAIQKLRSLPELKSVSVIGFVSHVQGELKQKAQEAGANMVLARSAFSTSLPQLLKRHSGAV
jgi:CheY-like chemotaxis protein